MQVNLTLVALTKYADPNAGVRLEFEPPSTPVSGDASFWAGTPTGRLELYVNTNQAAGLSAGQNFTLQLSQQFTV